MIYNAGFPEGTCPPCNAGLEMAYTEEFGASGLAEMAAKMLLARPDAHFYWRSTTPVCDHRKIGQLAFHNPAIVRLNTHLSVIFVVVRGSFRARFGLIIRPFVVGGLKLVSGLILAVKNDGRRRRIGTLSRFSARSRASVSRAISADS